MTAFLICIRSDTQIKISEKGVRNPFTFFFLILILIFLVKLLHVDQSGGVHRWSQYLFFFFLCFIFLFHFVTYFLTNNENDPKIKLKMNQKWLGYCERP
jgi:hypothetical protein